jgi:hypothetical protein
MYDHKFGKAKDFPGLSCATVEERIKMHGALSIARVLLPRVVNQDKNVLKDFLDLLRVGRMPFGSLGYMPYVLDAVQPPFFENLRLIASYGAMVSQRERFLKLKPGAYAALLKGGQPVFGHPELPAGVSNAEHAIMALEQNQALLVPVGEIAKHLQTNGQFPLQLAKRDLWAIHMLRIEGYLNEIV